MTDLRGKRAIVSGASRGIGRGVAIELAKAGAEVVVNFRSHPDEAEQVVEKCRQLSGCDAHAMQADFGNQQAVEGLVDEAVKRMGGVDIVVSNAVYSDRHLFLDSDLDEFSTELTKDGDGIFGIIGGVIEEDTGLPSPGAELSAARLFEISSMSLHMAVEGFTVRNGDIFLFLSISLEGL